MKRSYLRFGVSLCSLGPSENWAAGPPVQPSITSSVAVRRSEGRALRTCGFRFGAIEMMNLCVWCFIGASVVWADERPMKNSSLCVSNRGLPYNRDLCMWYGRDRGCNWQEGACRCIEGGVFWKSARRCWTQGQGATQSTSPPQPLAPLPIANDSVCVSNKGRPYSKSDCDWYGPELKCIWKNEICQCENGGIYSKTGRKCWPREETTTTTTTSPPAPPMPLSNGSVCVSNKGRPYTKELCEWYGPARGCIWLNEVCQCKDGGTYSKTGHKCWPAKPPSPETTTTSTSPPPSLPIADGSLCVSNHGKAYNKANCDWYGAPRGCVWLQELCQCKDHGFFYSKSGRKCRPALTTRPPGDLANATSARVVGMTDTW